MKKLFVLFLICFCSNISHCSDTLRWAADTESGAPNVFYSPDNNVVGFEAEIIEEVCTILGKKSVFCQNDWDWVFPGLNRGLYDVIIDGVPSNGPKINAVLFSIPYYVCQLALVTRNSDNSILSIEDCSHKKVGTLRVSRAQKILEQRDDVEILYYPSEYGAFSDLKNGRISAVLIDKPSAVYSGLKLGGLKIVRDIDEVTYSVAISENNRELADEINEAIFEMIKNGKLQSIICNWKLDNPLFQKYIYSVKIDRNAAFQKLLSGSKLLVSKVHRYMKLIPFFAKAAFVTLEVSVLSMILAVIFGLPLVLIRMYSPKWMQLMAGFAVEILRGTPLIIQIFFIFYGFPLLGVTLNPMVAGILALGVNYAAYESENFRAGLISVPSGQMEAARALGMSQWQSLRYVIIPQAFCFVLPPLTNDFIAILKDSSLVSLITVVELTKAYTTAASSSFDFFGTGIIVAIFYLLLGFPFVQLAKIAENHLALEKSAYKSKRVVKKPNVSVQ